MTQQIDVAINKVTAVSLISDAAPIVVGAPGPVIAVTNNVPVLPVRAIQTIAFATVWYEGAGIPDDATGTNGDLYLNLTNGDVYRKVSGTWF